MKRPDPLSREFKQEDNKRRREVLLALIDGDPKFFKLFKAYFPDSEDNDIGKLFAIGRTSDGTNANRRNLRGLHLKSTKRSAGDIARALEDSRMDCPNQDELQVTDEEWEAFLRMTTLLYLLLEQFIIPRKTAK